MYDQTSTGRDRGADVGATSHGPTSSSPATPDPGVGRTADLDPTRAFKTQASGTPTSSSDTAGEDTGMKERAVTTGKTGANAAAEGARDVAQTAKEQAREVIDEATTQARRTAADMRGQLRGQVEQQHGSMVDKLRAASQDMRDMSADRDPSPATTLVSSLADRTERFADELASRGPDGVLDEVQQFARRRPGTFLLAAAAAGFVAGRLGKGILGSSEQTPSGDRDYRSAYEAGSADMRGAMTTPTGEGTETYIRDDGDWTDPEVRTPEPAAVTYATGAAPGTGFGGAGNGTTAGGGTGTTYRSEAATGSDAESSRTGSAGDGPTGGVPGSTGSRDSGSAKTHGDPMSAPPARSFGGRS